MRKISDPFSVLGITLGDFYDVIAKNVSDIVERRNEWKGISLRVNSELSSEEQNAVLQLASHADDDDRFSVFADISREQGSPYGLGFYMAIADYTLGKRE